LELNSLGIDSIGVEVFLNIRKGRGTLDGDLDVTG